MRDQRMDLVIDALLAKRGITQHGVIGYVLKADSKAPAAFTLGGSLLGLTVGVVCVSPQLQARLTEDELEFVLAHEIGHILLNHIVPSVVVALGKETLASMIADALECNSRDAKNMLGLLQASWVVAKRRASADAELLARCELEADAYAVGLQARKEPALSCLHKLRELCGTSVSHAVETGGFRLPALTIEERIGAVERMWTSTQAQWSQNVPLL